MNGSAATTRLQGHCSISADGVQLHDRPVDYLGADDALSGYQDDGSGRSEECMTALRGDHVMAPICPSFLLFPGDRDQRCAWMPAVTCSTAPPSPAVHLGARRIIAVSTYSRLARRGGPAGHCRLSMPGMQALFNAISGPAGRRCPAHAAERVDHEAAGVPATATPHRLAAAQVVATRGREGGRARARPSCRSTWTRRSRT